jgi:hypothetical protein
VMRRLGLAGLPGRGEVSRVWCQGFDQGCGFSRTAAGRNPWHVGRYRNDEDVVGVAWYGCARGLNPPGFGRGSGYWIPTSWSGCCAA